MNEQLKQRLVGAAVLVLLAVIFIPVILDRPPEPAPRIERPAPPPKKPAEEFSSRIVPLDAPRTPMVEAERKRKQAAVPEPAPQPAAPPRQPEPAPEPETAAAPPPPPEPEPAEAGPGGWAVQLGSFSSEKNAIALRDELKQKGYAVFLEKARTDSGDITRVMVGPELERKRAAELKTKLRAETDLEGLVVQYPGS